MHAVLLASGPSMVSKRHNKCKIVSKRKIEYIYKVRDLSGQ